MPRLRRALIVTLGVLAALAVVLAAPAHAATVNVTVADNVFQPATATVAQGDTVVWTQPGSRVHNVTADDGSFTSGNLTAGGTFSRVFDTPGTFRYYCSIHGAPGGVGMSGVVVVQAAQVTTTTTTAAPTTTTTAAAATTTTTAAAAAATTTSTPASQVLSASGAAGESATAASAATAQPAALAATGLPLGYLAALGLALLLTGFVVVSEARRASG